MESFSVTKRRLRNAYLSSVVSISLVLLLIGVAAFLLVNSNVISDYFRENLKVTAILVQKADDAAAASLEKSLSGKPFVGSTQTISREQGIAEMSAMLGGDFLDAFQSSPIPLSVEITLKPAYVNPDSLEVVRKALSSNPVVEEVVYQKSLVESLNENLSRISLVLGIFLALLLFISFVLISNTVRLGLFARRFTIHTMKMVGATRSFIRRPFMTQALFQGIISALLAIIMLEGALVFVKKGFPQLFQVFSLPLLLQVFAVILLCGLTLCMLSTFLVVNRLVRINKDDLYY